MPDTAVLFAENVIIIIILLLDLLKFKFNTLASVETEGLLGN